MNNLNELHLKFANIDSILSNQWIQREILHQAKKAQIVNKDLEVKVYLHLPRFTFDELRQETIVKNEIVRLAETIKINYQESNLSYLNDDYSSLPIENLIVEPVNGEIVNVLLGKLHFLNSIRENSINLGLKEIKNGRILGVISFSSFDLFHIDTSPFLHEEVKILSRLFTINKLSRNMLSRFIKLAKSWLSNNLPEIKLLLTYLNPNVGYRGTIYKATNWKIYAREHNVRYVYLNGNYVTDRFLYKTFGTANSEKLKEIGASDITFSKIKLHPLIIYACRTNNEDLEIDSIQDTYIERS